MEDSSSPSIRQQQQQHQQHRHPMPRSSPFILRATAIASLGGILFGYDMGVVSGALPQLTSSFDLTRNEQELVVSVLYLGGGVGAAVGGMICDFVGRKRTIILTDIGFGVGAVVLFASQTFHHVVMGRIIVGFAVSVSGIADVSYLHEIAPTEWRGSIVSVNEACISLGFLLAYVAGYVLDHVDPKGGWRTMFGLSGVIALIQLLGMVLCMPESPVWLKEKGRFQESNEALEMIHGGVQHQPVATAAIDSDTTTEEEHSMPQATQSDRTVPSTSSAGRQLTVRRSFDHLVVEDEDGIAPRSSRYSSLDYTADDTTTDVTEADQSRCCCDTLPATCNGSLRASAWRRSCFQLRQVLSQYHRQVWIAVFLSVTQQLCGQTSVLNYAPFIFASIGLASNNSTLGSTLLIGVVKFLVTVLVIWKIEYLGRRFLLLAGMSIIALGLLMLTIAFAGMTTAGAGVNDDGDDNSNAVQVSTGGIYLALPGVLFVVLGYSASFGPLTWLLTSELFPTDIRGRALGSSTIVTYLCAAFTTYTFLSAQSWLGPSIVFALYGIITICGIVFSYLAIPDTGGRSVKEIDGELNKMWWWSKRGASGGAIVENVNELAPTSGYTMKATPVYETELT